MRRQFPLKRLDDALCPKLPGYHIGANAIGEKLVRRRLTDSRDFGITEGADILPGPAQTLKETFYTICTRKDQPLVIRNMRSNVVWLGLRSPLQ